MARTHGPHFHALLPDEPSAAAIVRTPQPSQSGERGIVSRHLASSGRDALRPKDGTERSSCLLSSRSSACFKICKRPGECPIRGCCVKLGAVAAGGNERRRGMAAAAHL